MLKRLFKSQTLPHAALAMVGAKAGDSVLVVGTRHPAIAADIARTTGLNGQTVVVGAEGDRRAIEAAAAEAGALLEFQPVETAAIALRAQIFDVVVWAQSLASLSDADRTRQITEAFAAIRPGGRIIVIDGGSTRGLLWRSPAPTVEASLVLGLLTEAGGRAARALGTIDNLKYYEARKSR